MKKLITSIVLAVFFFTPTQAQWWSGTEEVNGNGNMTTESRTVSDYDRVSLLGSMDVQLVAGKEGNLKIEAEENLLKHIITEVEGNSLKIRVEKGYRLDPSRNMEIKVVVPFESLDAVTLTGSGDIYSADEIRSKNFEIKIVGSGDVKLFVTAKDATAGVTGSGDIELKGSAENFDCKVTGSGDISAFNFKSATVSATVLGSGDIQVYASEELSAKTPGSGDIEYRGNPKKENFRTMGSGSITKR
ncbi:head GIN domain-containing protein [Salinimicrobium gaetbulicola]|uniref:Head GIN domain-containing protein n=1 Tax=Salinimicrobium gaetbulicola TaxID=999702 RepID=A0ABW3IBX6_9FLAO